MRKISLVLVAAMLLTAGNLFANDFTKVEPSKKLSTQIAEMLNDNKIVLEQDYDELTAQIRFTINNEGEIVVMSVDTENNSLEGFVKSKLNYQKVELDNFKEGKIYTIPVRIKA
ncbi:hypothetical protein GGR42_002947 [Saonia flava]|uniref:Uncharacterized protein n=1 Tax=Saonia flava TaxID=523696 RepID=A0A846QU16_9FLAO|nr:hypothetical protein [Saonia flava]NJB72456.1 hypothetical protein [Saonia flava]